MIVNKGIFVSIVCGFFILIVLAFCLPISGCSDANNKTTVRDHIPLNINYYNGPISIYSKGSDDPKVQKTFKYAIPETPNGFTVKKKVEEQLGLFMVYENSDGEVIIYTQNFAKDGYVDISLPNGGGIEATEDTIKHRNAVIIETEDEYYIIVEDGVDVFEIKGQCDHNILLDMAKEVLSAD